MEYGKKERLKSVLVLVKKEEQVQELVCGRRLRGIRQPLAQQGRDAPFARAAP